MALKKGDFAEIVYTGRIAESGKVFDTNDSDIAKKEGLKNKDQKPIIVCIGEGDVVKGMDDALEGKEAGKSFSVEVPAEKGFGKKDAKMYKLVPASLFKGEFQPVPGLQVSFQNGASGIIKTVSGGRILVDFNHPLAGQSLKYDVKVIKQVTDDAEKLKGFVDFYLGAEGTKVEVAEGKAVLKFKMEMPEEIQKLVREKAMKRIPTLKSLEIESEKKTEKPAVKEDKKEPAKEAALPKKQ